MVGHLEKTLPVRFLKYGLVTELLRDTCKGNLILSILAAYVPGNPNSNNAKIKVAESVDKQHTLIRIYMEKYISV